ncbi:MAG TPA: FG-GAP-like repeat-containing protein [Acidimicrobiales bacterium]|nr:FG-GAP-like repeat-containing protein [Acidimicrobiales bacterium]
MALVTLAGCNLGVAPVPYELVDAEDFDLPLGPTGMASGDIDGDGDLDVVATGRDGYATLTNDGSGAYALDFPNSYEPFSLHPSLVDVEGDGDLDLVSSIAALSSPQALVPSVRRNDGTGAFGPVEVVQPDPPPGDLTALISSDADGDGDVDMLAAFRVDQERYVGTYLNDGTGGFGAPATDSLAFTSDRATPVNLVAGDLDGDGDDDVVATDTWHMAMPDGEVVDRTVAMVGLNDGTGAFAAAGSPIEVGSDGDFWALSPALADLDDDGNLDLAVGGGGSIATLLGSGSGGFGAPQFNPVPDTRVIDFLTSADIDEDGKIDLVGFDDILKATSGVVAYGDGAGGIAQVHEVGTGTGLGDDGTPGREVEITDLEGDGDPDILFLAGGLGVVENATEGLRPTH